MGINWDLLKALYLRGDRASQLNSLHLNLARIQILATGHTDELIALHLIRESQYFIEWIVPTLDLETNEISLATSLVDLQRQLSRWKLEWEKYWGEEEAREEWQHGLSNGVIDFSNHHLLTQNSTNEPSH